MVVSNLLILALREFFERLTDEELRSLMLRVGRRAHLELPGRAASHAEVAQRAAELVVSHGALDGDLLSAMMELRPRSEAALDALAQAAGVVRPTPAPPSRAQQGIPWVAVAGCAWVCGVVIYTLLAKEAPKVDEAGAMGKRGLEASAVRTRGENGSSPAAPPGRDDPPTDVRQERDIEEARSVASPDRRIPGGRPSRGGKMGGDKAASPVAQPVPVAMLAEGGSASDVGGQWSVARVEGKRLTLSGAAMPERGLLTLVTPVDGRRFVGEVLCRIEEAPGTCWVVAMPGNDLPEVGDVFVRAPPEAR